MADPRIINYAGGQKIYNKEKVDELLAKKQDITVSECVKIGEIMDWPQFHTESRIMSSDRLFEFTFNGKTHKVDVAPKDIELEIADNVPDGWRAMDGSVELNAVTNQELADFFGGRNTTIDGKIWIPYLPRKIIKVAY